MKFGIPLSLSLVTMVLSSVHASSSELTAVSIGNKTIPQSAVSKSQPMVVSAYKKIRKNEYPSAIATLEASLKVDPANIEAHRYLAFSYMHVGKVGSALKEASYVIKDGIEHPHDAHTMGEAKFYGGEPKKAIEFYREALLLNPLHIDARAGVIRCLMAMGRFSEAKAICKQAAYGYQGDKGKYYFRRLLSEINSKTQIASTTVGS